MITKAIIPVAGWGTRRLPITKAIEKCMLPIGNVPAIDFVVQDCLLAGIKDIYFVVSGEAHQLKTYYSRYEELENYLEEKGKADMLASIMPPENASFHFVTQDLSDGRYGTTVALWLCRNYIEKDEQVLVVMGDNIFYRTEGSNAADLMQFVSNSNAKSGLFGVPVPEEDIPKYGIIEKDASGNYMRIIEKPSIEDAPSNLNNASFYLFDAAFFEYVDKDMVRPHQGEYMIIDAINEYVADGNVVKVAEAKGEYFDMGDLKSWLRANNKMLENTIS